MKSIWSILFFCLFSLHGYGQLLEVWPGDISNNGQVNYVDLLYFQQAQFQEGPPRIINGVGWFPYLATPWTGSFPDGTNFAHADCNGDGKVDVFDLNAFGFNYGSTNDSLREDAFAIGTMGVHPPVYFDTINAPTTIPDNSQIFIPILLGTDTLPALNVASIGFQVRYDPAIFSEVTIFTGFPDPLGPPPPSMIFPEVGIEMTPGVVDVAAGLDFPGFSVSVANASVAFFTGIITEDLVGYQEQINTSILIENAVMFNENGELLPVTIDSTSFTIVANPTTSIEAPSDLPGLAIRPNPVSDWMQIFYPTEPIERVEVFSASGLLVRTFESGEHNPVFDTSDLPSGFYMTKAYVADGRYATRKIIKK